MSGIICSFGTQYYAKQNSIEITGRDKFNQIRTRYGICLPELVVAINKNPPELFIKT